MLVSIAKLQKEEKQGNFCMHNSRASKKFQLLLQVQFAEAADEVAS